ncbi:MAG: ABC transporter permease [Candidatus Aminicenantes bacterium]|nr:ABC transporter permease [Candidatus Aminicenantes bacterium]
MAISSLSRQPSGVFWVSWRDVFKFYFFLGTHSRRPKLFFLLSLVPLAMAIIFKGSQIIYGYPRFSGLFIYSNMIMMFFLQFLILLLTLFFGTSVCREEVEGKTLPYIVTRPLHKIAFLLGKYTAYTLLVSIMIIFSLTLSFIIMNLDRLGDLSLYKVLLRDGGVLLLGIWCYAALFTFLGVIFKKAIFFGLLFSFGWENIIQYFPGKTQKLAVVHYLKSLLPPLSQEGFPFLLFRLEPTPRGEAILILLGLTFFFLGLSCALFAGKEFIIEA